MAALLSPVSTRWPSDAVAPRGPSSPSIYLVSTGEGGSDGSSHSKSLPPPKGRDAGPPFCFFQPGWELNHLPRLHRSCWRAGGRSQHPRAGRKVQEGEWKLLPQATGLLKRLQTQNLSQDLRRSAVNWKRLRNMQLPSAYSPRVAFQSCRVPGCVGVRWACGWRCWVGACGGFARETQKTHKILWQLPKLEIFLSVFSGKARKYLLQKTVNWFFYEALLCQIQGLEIMIKVNRHFNLLCIQSLIQFQFQPHHKIIQTASMQGYWDCCVPQNDRL